MASPHSVDDEFESVVIDPAEPLKGIVVCCTSIPPDQRTSIASKVAELGGIHKYDLTPDVTHLIVGDYDTPKYRHVARERPDIKAMDITWIEAMSELWKNDDDIDYAALESQYQLKPLEKRGVDSSNGQPAARESLLICLTGFGDQRDAIAQKITSGGGLYTGDLTRRCTHLIVNKPEGKKFAAAKSWGIYAVTLTWLDQTMARGMILEESKFDPILPPEEQGKGAWVKKDPRRAAWGKRSRSAMANAPEDGPRKLRKTASMKLNSQRNNLWGDILGRATSREYSFAYEQEKPPVDDPQSRGEQEPTPRPQPQPQPEPTIPVLQEQQGVFANCYFYVHGFTTQRTSVLEQTIATLGGSICSFLHEAALGPFPTTPLGRFLIVPQTSQPETHPPENYDGLYVVTEYYIESCLHNKTFFDPNEHVLGRPFPLFPIPGFADLTVCTAAFTGIELNQVARSLAQLGARFEEEFRRGISVLVCKSLASMRKEKLRMAIKWGVPVVSAEWLWECISTGFKVPLEDFIFPELKDRYEMPQPQPQPLLKPVAVALPKAAIKLIKRTYSDPFVTTSKPSKSKPPAGAGVDTTAFDHDSPEKPRQKPSETHDSLVTADFATALTHPAAESFPQDHDFEAPLTEASSARLNKSPPVKHTFTRTRSEPTKTSRPSPPPEDAILDTKRSEQQEQQRTEEAKKQAKAAERQALASKLTSLIESTGSTSTTSTTNRTASRVLADNAPDDEAPRPRRRRIFGRAISNVSNASSDAARSDSLRDSEAAGSQAANQQQEPPSTQLEYRDPRAQECKAALMSRMMGGSGSVDAKPVLAKGVEGLGVVGGRSMRRR